MDDSLFPDRDGGTDKRATPRKSARGRGVEPAPASPTLPALRDALPTTLRLGTSSWGYPGWIGSVWAQEYTPQKLSKQGLRAYAQHPLLRAVSLDRAFYRPLDAGQYAAYAAQVPDDFRFIVKAPALIADPLLRDDAGRGVGFNPSFLAPHPDVHTFSEPALQGLRPHLGPPVFHTRPGPRP